MGNICCAFGHRKIYGEIPVLYSTLERLIREKGIKTFMTGGMGEFDRIFAETVNILKKKCPEVQLILVIPYITEDINKNKEYYEKTYDEIVIPETLEGVHPKTAIGKRNRWMIEHSGIVVVYHKRVEL